MPKHLSQKFSEELHKNPWWTYKHDIYTKPNGEDGDYYYGEAPGTVFIVPMLPDGRLLLTLQFRYLDQKMSIEFPGGAIDATDVDIERAAQRELKEEIGYEADHMVKLGVFQPSNGYVKDMIHVFLAYVSDPGEQDLDDSEDIEVIIRRPDEFQEMVQHGEIWCGQTLAAWALVQSYLMNQEDTKLFEAPNVKRIMDSIFGLLDF